MTRTERATVGGYRVERGRLATDMWFLVDPETGRYPGVLFPLVDGRWKGLPPSGPWIERDIGDAPNPHLAMARQLVKAAKKVQP